MPKKKSNDAEQADAVLCGARLQAIRIAKQIALEDVAEHLRLSKQFVAALEENDYQNMPGVPYVRGYLRSYAKYLDTNWEPIREEFESLPWVVDNDRDKVKLNVQYSCNDPMKKSDFLHRYGRALLVCGAIVVVIIFIIILLSNMGGDEKPVVTKQDKLQLKLTQSTALNAALEKAAAQDAAQKARVYHDSAVAHDNDESPQPNKMEEKESSVNIEKPPPLHTTYTVVPNPVNGAPDNNQAQP